ncbi:pilus assembly protein [Halomonas sp. TRM85114]|uniref:TadE family protein n=1 Tax=Halomonas jincaotanensis TaxID=2810616 RepID=UPI001BD67795|nr:TadE/TadG family type IV pilus assembly protein [Halomonas jincaotanensis]MBS9405260.1 pilus assembly protein [Halomonas jincaotanensis]
MKMGRSLHRQKGSELVEFAISATVLFLLLFGIIEFSVALFDKATLTNASREGARTGILYRPADPVLDTRNLPEEDAAIKQAVRNYAEKYLISLGGPAQMDIDIDRSDPDMSPGSYVTVVVDYPYQYLVLPGFIGDLGGVLNLSATTVMRAE